MGIAIPAASMVFAGCEPQVGNGSHSVEHVTLETFQIPEVVPNTALDNFEAVRGSIGTLKRSDDRIRVKVNTQDLPDGVYTYWWHLAHDDGEVSILWAGSSIVDGGNGTAHLDSTLPEGEENAPGYIFIGHGLQPGASRTVQVQLWVRDHGELSDDPELAYRQQNRPFGGCTDTRNPLPHNDDYPCWNPQRAVFGN
jgi:hypothetical protein